MKYLQTFVVTVENSRINPLVPSEIKTAVERYLERHVPPAFYPYIVKVQERDDVSIS